jgi:tetratricopeptide (TPR) repeat protein
VEAAATTPAAAASTADGAPARRTTRADHLGASTFGAKGWTAFAAGDYAAAEAAYAQALALAPGDYEAAALYSWALAALGRDDDALLAAQRVLAATPPAGPAALARVTLGRVCLRKGITGEGFEHLTRVTRDDADRRATLYATLHLGQAYTERGMYDDAVAFLRRALALGPNLVEAHYALGRAHWLAGAAAAADEAWRAGAASGKFSPWAARCEEIRRHMQGGGDLPAA